MDDTRSDDLIRRNHGLLAAAAKDLERFHGDALVLVVGESCKFVATDRPPTIAGPTRRIRVGNCARAIAVVTDANVGAGHADAVDTCRKVALRLRCAMNGRASCEQGCSLCKRLTKTIKGHPISRIDEVLSRRFAVRPRISNRMKNIQVINGALNCTFSLFQATDEEFALLFPGPQQDIQYVEDLVHLAEQSEINSALCRIWERPIRKSEAQGIHGTLFYQLERYKKWYREKREDAIEPSAINSAQRGLFGDR